MNLVKKKCLPCEGKTKKLSQTEISGLHVQIPSWKIKGERIEKHFRFKDFLHAMSFIQHMANLAEAEGHHPDFCVHYNQVHVTLWTHATQGLSENDFILAAKIDQIENKAKSIS